METDAGKINDAVSALLQLTMHGGRFTAKTVHWDGVDRLDRKAMIDNPANKAKSVVMGARLRMPRPARFPARPPQATVSWNGRPGRGAGRRSWKFLHGRVLMGRRLAW